MIKINGYCFNCDIDFTVSHSDKTSDVDLGFCPFCSMGIESDDSDIDSDEDELEDFEE